MRLWTHAPPNSTFLLELNVTTASCLTLSFEITGSRLRYFRCPSHQQHSSWGIQRHYQAIWDIYSNPSSKFWAYCGVSSKLDMSRRHPNQIPFPPQLAPIVVNEQQLYSELSKLLPQSLRLSSATLQTKLISAFCIHNLILSSVSKAHGLRCPLDMSSW